MKKAAIIPARLESQRLPRKLLKPLLNKPLIQWVYENTKNFGVFDSIHVATDSKEIEKVCLDFGCKVIITGKDHESGTSRLSEAIKSIEADIIVNIQGDEPFIKTHQINSLITNLISSENSSIATLVVPSKDYEGSCNPNIVKAVKDTDNNALYFSRLAIPYNRENPDNGQWFHHMGVYAYKRSFLENYPNLKESYLEKVEKLEQLKFLANGYKILLVETNEKTIGIDTEEDFKQALEIFKNR